MTAQGYSLILIKHWPQKTQTHHNQEAPGRARLHCWKLYFLLCIRWRWQICTVWQISKNLFAYTLYRNIPQYILGTLSSQAAECTVTHKQRFTLHHLRIRTPCSQTPHIHHSFCFMTAFQLPYSVPGIIHTPSAYHKPLKYSCSCLSPNPCSEPSHFNTDKISCW